MNTEESIRELLILADHINDEYLSPHPSTSNLANLLNLEKDKLQILQSHQSIIRQINKTCKKFVVADQNNLPYGLISFIDRKDYPYYRLLSHIEEQYPQSIKDLVITLLYGELMKLTAKSQDISKRAYQILINSPIAEQQIVDNNLAPLMQVYDTIDFEINLNSLISSVIRGEVQPVILTPDEEKISYFIEKLLYLANYLVKSKLLISNDKIPIKMVKSYVSALMAIFNEDELHDMLNNCLDLLPNDIKDFVVDRFDEATKLIALKSKVFIKA